MLSGWSYANHASSLYITGKRTFNSTDEMTYIRWETLGFDGGED